MNSKVKQAQKEGAEVSDISAGLAYSVIKNALYKVIKVSDASELGKHIVVQGGTFYNDAVLRSFEKIANCQAIRPDIAGIMGAFGAALIARERYQEGEKTSMLSIDQINSLQYTTSMSKLGRVAFGFTWDGLNTQLVDLTCGSRRKHHLVFQLCEEGIPERVIFKHIQNNVDELSDPSITFRNPFLAFTSEDILTNRLVEEFQDIPAAEVKAAAHKAWEELAAVHTDIQKKGEETLQYLKETGRRGIVLAGRPYHIDPEIHHGIPDMINSYGIAVFTEDSVAHLGHLERPIRVNDQWMYHSRLYSAANFVKTREDLDLIQLNSFG